MNIRMSISCPQPDMRKHRDPSSVCSKHKIAYSRLSLSILYSCPRVPGPCTRSQMPRPCTRSQAPRWWRNPTGPSFPRRARLEPLGSATTSRTHRRNKIAYIQNDQKKDQVRRWCIDQQFLLGGTPKRVTNRLRQIGWLSWCTRCPYCGAKPRDSHSRTDRFRNNARVQARCPKKKCHRRIPWTSDHPLLHLGRQGRSTGQQSALYLSILLGCSQHAIAVHFGVARRTVGLFVSKLKTFISEQVIKKQNSFTLAPHERTGRS